MQYDEREKTRGASPASKLAASQATKITTPTASATQQPVWTQAMGNQAPVLANSTDQRQFVNTAIQFLNGAAEFYRAGAVVDESRLQRQLIGWKETLLGSLNIIRTALNNDAKLEADLRYAYQNAVQALMSAATTQLKKTPRQLYETYRESIQEWAGLYATSTPVGKDAVLKDDGSAVLQAGGIPVIVKPDTFSQEAGQSARTTFEFGRQFHWETMHGTITDFTGPKTTLTIQTEYKHDVKPLDQSGYGKGTSEEDKKQEKTTVRYHEGSHGLDFIQFLRENPLPVFTGKKGMSIADFQAAIHIFIRAMKKYEEAMKAFTIARTHCVGITIDEFNHVHGVECK